MPFLRRSAKRTHDVFGISNEVLPDSYVDRGALDKDLARLLDRRSHVALRGASKCGKSWLRQTVLPDAIVVQCRLGKSVADIYTDALSSLGVALVVESSAGSSSKGKLEAKTELGLSLLVKAGITAGGEWTLDDSQKTKPVGQDVQDLAFVAEIIKASGLRLVVEDFHYLAVEERQRFAFDLKTLWDYGLFIVIVGVWSKQNMLLLLNPDLTGRVEEVPVVWTHADLSRVFDKGGAALALRFSEELKSQAIRDCFENVGVLQKLIIGTLDELGIFEAPRSGDILIESLDALVSAEMKYVDQLNPLYLVFAERVSIGVRSRKKSIGIYSHAIATILSATDDELIHGLSLDAIYENVRTREPRIQRAALRTALKHFEQLQVDQEGRGIIIAYNDTTQEILVIDRQLLLYRKYATVKWPWEDLIVEASKNPTSFRGGD